MLQQSIFTAWQSHHAELWGRTPLLLRHRLHEDPLFSTQALTALIDRYPREHYQIVQFGDHGSERATWREGEIGGLNGEGVIDAISRGRFFMNLRNLPKVDPRYGDLLSQIFDEIEERVPDLRTFTRSIGVLISSPTSRTLYHADLPGQTLWQIRGRKRVYVYPDAAPFVSPRQIEQIALTGVEYNLPYHSWYDDHATVFDLEPGQMLTWQLNAPHRVENLGVLNVSMTLEYFTEDVRRKHMVTMANGILRTRFGLSPQSRDIDGPTFWSKALLQKAMRKTRWAKREQQRVKKAPDFRLDPALPEAMIDLKAA